MAAEQWCLDSRDRKRDTAFWFSAHVNTSAGDYTTGSIDLSVHVFNFAIPAELHVQSQMNYSDARNPRAFTAPASVPTIWTYVDKSSST